MLPNTKKSINNLFPVISIDGVKMLDFWMAWRVAQEFKNNVKNYDYLLVQENDQWDTIAQEVYGDRQLWWVLAIFNDVEDPFSMYFEKGVPGSIVSLKYLDNTNVGILLNKIREKRLEFEKR